MHISENFRTDVLECARFKRGFAYCYRRRVSCLITHKILHAEQIEEFFYERCYI